MWHSIFIYSRVYIHIHTNIWALSSSLNIRRQTDTNLLRAAGGPFYKYFLDRHIIRDSSRVRHSRKEGRILPIFFSDRGKKPGSLVYSTYSSVEVSVGLSRSPDSCNLPLPLVSPLWTFFVPVRACVWVKSPHVSFNSNTNENMMYKSVFMSD